MAKSWIKPHERLSTDFVEAIAPYLDDSKPVVGWDDSLAHDHLLGGDDFEDFVNVLAKRCGVAYPDEPVAWIPSVDVGLFNRHELHKADRMSVAYLAQVFERKT